MLAGRKGLPGVRWRCVPPTEPPNKISIIVSCLCRRPAAHMPSKKGTSCASAKICGECRERSWGALVRTLGQGFRATPGTPAGANPAPPPHGKTVVPGCKKALCVLTLANSKSVTFFIATSCRHASEHTGVMRAGSTCTLDLGSSPCSMTSYNAYFAADVPAAVAVGIPTVSLGWGAWRHWQATLLAFKQAHAPYVQVVLLTFEKTL